MTLSSSDLEDQRRALQMIQARLRGDVQGIASSAFGDGSESRSPQHMAELGSENFEQDFALDLIRNEQETLREISHALEKINQGSYGLCEQCLKEGKLEKKAAIAKARLKAIPWVRNCVDCETKRENHLL